MTRRAPDRLGRRSLGAAALVTSVAVTFSGLVVQPAAADQTYYIPVSRTWTVNGHGYGHGHGLSQYGAQGAALRGVHHGQILDFYYPGTKMALVKGKVRVLVGADWTSDLQVRPKRRLSVTDLADHERWRLPRRTGLDRWRLSPVKDGSTAVQFHNVKGWHRWRIPDGRETFRSDGQFRAPGTLTLLMPGSGDVVSRSYRGVLRLARPYPGAESRDTVNVLRMDAYVQGVVPYEMPASWHQQALRSQAVAARTYAAWQRAQNRSRYYQICDSVACQVYGGVAGETTATNDAVHATARKILTFGGEPAFTQFSASSGGWSADGGQPYLPAHKDPYDNFAANSVHDWTTTVSVSTLENRYPEVGHLIDLRVTKRDGHGAWGGRIKQAVLDGTRGKAYVTGDDLRFLYGLRSEWLSIAATPIIERWRSLGGRDASIGLPRSGQFKVSGGAAQKFQHGGIYWSARTGAHALQGPILFNYRDWGASRSNLGFPVKELMGAYGRGHKAAFQGGWIFSKTRTGAHVLYGRILERWTRAGATRSWLGYPTSHVFRVDGGLRAKFQGGIISWDRSTDSFRIARK